jgi:hypothetical protein
MIKHSYTRFHLRYFEPHACFFKAATCCMHFHRLKYPHTHVGLHHIGLLQTHEHVESTRAHNCLFFTQNLFLWSVSESVYCVKTANLNVSSKFKAAIFPCVLRKIFPETYVYRVRNAERLSCLPSLTPRLRYIKEKVAVTL